MTIAFIIISAILAVALTVTVVKLFKVPEKLEQLKSENAQISLEKTRVEERLAAEVRGRIADAEAMERRIADERAAMGDRFKAMASEVLQANSQQLDRQSRISLEAVLNPMKTSLETFTRDFKDCYATEHSDRLSLREGIQTLAELNRRVSEETQRLTHALKGDTRMQGHWGEMVLQNILEHSGLEQGRWFVTQESDKDEDGNRLRPDAVINCPKERKIIIDSKVSLSSYLDWLNADNDAARETCSKAHIKSVENHIRCLRDKSYQDKIGVCKADFVLMFMPHEGAYLMAMQTAPDLWQRAYESRVVIVSPTHLVTVVKLVEQMWQSEDHNLNALKIADEASKMLEKLIAMLDDFAKVGDSLSKSQIAYDNAIKKLKDGNGNVIKRIENLERLGVRTKKSLPAKMTAEPDVEDVVDED